MSGCANPPSSHNPKLAFCEPFKDPFECGKPRVLCPNEIAQRFRNATVGINVIPRFQILPPVDVVVPPPGAPVTADPLETPTLQTVPYESNGFFVDRGYIVGSSAWLVSVFQALLLQFLSTREVRLNPTDILTIPTNNIQAQLQLTVGAALTLAEADLPTAVEMINILLNGATIDGSVPISVDGVNTAATLADFFDIYISVYEVNRCPASYVYRGYLVGTDLRTGVAVYRIDKCDAWNRCLPIIENQPYLQLGSSLTYGPGNPVFFLGRWNGVAPMSFSCGCVNDNSVVDVNGLITYEGFATSIPADVGVVGGPILNQCAQVVGIATALSNQHTIFGVSSHFAKNIIDEIIKSDRECSSRVVYAPLLGFSVFRHAAMDVCYVVLTPNEIGLLSQDLTVPTVDAATRRYRDPQFCRENRELRGLLVTSVGGNLACAVTEDICADVPPFPSAGPGSAVARPRNFRLEAGDIIMSVNGVPMGQLPGQTGLESVLYRLCCGDVVQISFLKMADAYTQEYVLCTELEDSLAWINDIEGAFTAPGAGILNPAFLAYFAGLVPAVELSLLTQNFVRQFFLGAYSAAYPTSPTEGIISSWLNIFDPIPYQSALQMDFSANLILASNPISHCDALAALLASLNGVPFGP